VVFQTPPEVVSGIGRGGPKSPGGDKCPSQYHLSDPPPSVKVRKARGVRNFLCPWIKFWGCVKVKLREGK
jgi:hypothetical protein